MSLDDLLSNIDDEIARLQQVRALLTGSGTTTRGGRMSSPGASPKLGRKRTMSAEARRRIGEAQRKRWAAQKKATNAK